MSSQCRIKGGEKNNGGIKGGGKIEGEIILTHTIHRVQEIKRMIIILLFINKTPHSIDKGLPITTCFCLLCKCVSEAAAYLSDVLVRLR